MLDELEWPSLEARREQSSLTFFYKIHSGTVSLDKDKYLTPAPNIRRTRASHEFQYTNIINVSKKHYIPESTSIYQKAPRKHMQGGVCMLCGLPFYVCLIIKM